MFMTWNKLFLMRTVSFQVRREQLWAITKTLQIAIFSALKEIFILENEEGYVLMKLVLVDVLFILNLMEVLVKILWQTMQEIELPVIVDRGS